MKKSHTGRADTQNEKDRKIFIHFGRTGSAWAGDAGNRIWGGAGRTCAAHFRTDGEGNLSLADPAPGDFVHGKCAGENEAAGERKSQNFSRGAESSGDAFDAGNSGNILFSGDFLYLYRGNGDGGEETESLPPNQSLSIICYNTEEEIAFCAANLTDWLQFVRNTGQYPWGTEPLADRALAQVWVGSGEDYFLFNIEPEKILTGELSWNEGYHLLKETLTEAFCEHEEEKEAYGELRKEQEALARENQAEETWDFMDTYDGSFEKECQIGDGRIRYRMVVEDAALGSRFYGLLKSTDAGESWELFSSDPFQQQLGQGIDFTFLDEELGFATLMHNGGDEARLYVTENGGLSYEPVVMEGYTVSLEDGFTYNPYDYPQMPYEEGGMIFVLCGQGADGDYNGGDQAGLALYQSADGGHTFSFVEIRSRD